MKSYMEKEEYMHHWFRLLGIVGLTVLLGFPSPVVAQVLHEEGWPLREQPQWTPGHDRECWDIPDHCVSVTTPQTADRFYVEVTNRCSDRFYAGVHIQYAPGGQWGSMQIHGVMFPVLAGETQRTWVAKSAKPTGRYHVRWIGSASSITDQKCARRHRNWDENPFPE